MQKNLNGLIFVTSEDYCVIAGSILGEIGSVVKGYLPHFYGLGSNLDKSCNFL